MPREKRNFIYFRLKIVYTLARINFKYSPSKNESSDSLESTHYNKSDNYLHLTVLSHLPRHVYNSDVYFCTTTLVTLVHRQEVYVEVPVFVF